MKKIDLNKIPGQVKSKEITTKTAIDIISSFICINYPVFGLHHYDEDFREEIILQLIEKKERLFNNYKEEQGDFFNYLYCYITGLIRTINRTSAKKKILESIAFSEQVKGYEEKQYNYNHINFKYVNSPRIPYSASVITPDSLKSAFENVNKDKELLIIAMKSAFYLTDEQITKICSYYNLNKYDFYKTIEFYRNSLMIKSQRKQHLLERRNNAYYNHKKYEKQLQLLENCDFAEDKIVLKNHLLRKNQKQYKSWLNLTNQLRNGLLSVRPSNKVIAEVLGICERQVIYYIKRAKKREQKEQEKKKVNNE